MKKKAKRVSKKKSCLNRWRWTARIVGLLIVLFALPFYFGYGNPLPFTNPKNSLFDNVWLSAFPLIFIGLLAGWKWEKVGGYLVVLPIAIATIVGLFAVGEFIPGPMYVPLAVGIIYLVVGHKR